MPRILAVWLWSPHNCNRKILLYPLKYLLFILLLEWQKISPLLKSPLFGIISRPIILMSVTEPKVQIDLSKQIPLNRSSTLWLCSSRKVSHTLKGMLSLLVSESTKDLNFESYFKIIVLIAKCFNLINCSWSWNAQRYGSYQFRMKTDFHWLCCPQQLYLLAQAALKLRNMHKDKWLF